MVRDQCVQRKAVYSRNQRKCVEDERKGKERRREQYLNSLFG
jgi:hypothetical protein